MNVIYFVRCSITDYLAVAETLPDPQIGNLPERGTIRDQFHNPKKKLIELNQPIKKERHNV